MDNWIASLKKELSKPLPGAAAQLEMSPSKLRLPETYTPAASGSVMILLYARKGEVYTLFIKRAEYDGVHSGQISFPGGMYETGDDSRRSTALRETEEETGVSQNDMSVIGELTSLHIPVSNVDVLPFVAVFDGQPLFTPDKNEVEFVIEARVDDLINPDNKKKKMIHIGDFEIEAPYFNVNGHHVWGATAMILSEFLEIVKRINKR